MPNVLQQIREWASELPYWEQAALERLVGGTKFSDADYDDILQYLLEDGGLAPMKTRPSLGLLQPRLDATKTASRPVRIVKLSHLRNVNALAAEQTLTFVPSLTTIFGANGAGKSGYARVLGSAGFSRGDREVLGDVTRPGKSDPTISAEIEVADADGTTTSIHYDIGAPPPALRFFYVFDTASVRMHLTRSSVLSFTPAGLSHLTALADVTDEVRKRLESKISEKQRPNPFTTQFEGSSVIVTQLTTLGAKTDLVALRKLATLSPEERTQLTTLEGRIAELKLTSVVDALAPLRKQITALSATKAALAKAEAALADTEVEKARASIATWAAAQTAAATSSIDQFRTGRVEGIGSTQWQQLAEAARAFAHAQAAHAYPREGDPCLLCHRPLETAQVDLLERLWTFLDGATTENLKAARDVLDAKVRTLDALDLHLDDDAMALVGERLPALVARRDALVAALRSGENVATDLPSLESPGPVIAARIETLERQAAELSQKDASDELSSLRATLLTLQHRALLSQLLPEVEAYVADYAWAARADTPKVRGSTKHITSKYNELFTELVTERYVELFEQVLVKLNCPRRVKVQTKAQKGETRKQVVLERPEGATSDGTLEKVLSEGEQRAVALADFFTEVTLDDQSAGIVLDDPVTSLDFEWKDTIARYLVDEATRRQVIVFTHDLHFLYRLRENAEEQAVAVAAHWIEKREGTPGWVFLDNSPVVEKDYRKATIASDLWKRAIAADTRPDERQRLISDGFGALRTCYEAFVIFDMFGDVVKRFEERISIERMKDVVIDSAIRDEVIEKVALLSRYIQGHLHSDRYVAQKPTPDHLKAEIDSFEALRKRLKAIKKASGASD